MLFVSCALSQLLNSWRHFTDIQYPLRVDAQLLLTFQLPKHGLFKQPQNTKLRIFCIKEVLVFQYVLESISINKTAQVGASRK
jgi:hypothetical protein